MSEHNDVLYLAHIDQAASRIEQTAFVRGRIALDTDFELRDATMYRLQTLAESTQRLSLPFKEAHPEIPWDDIAGFRNRVVHGYLAIDVEIIWDIVEREVPPLAECVRNEMEVIRTKEKDARDTGLDVGF